MGELLGQGGVVAAGRRGSLRISVARHPDTFPPMTSRHEQALLAGLAIAAGYAALLRPRLRRWGATDAEAAAPYPGSDLIAGGKRTATIAATIDASPSHVWPWLVQMGWDRAGWYSWDRLDRGGIPSEDRIHAEWQDIHVGDRLAATPSASAWFEVAAVEPDRFLALRAPLNLGCRARPFDTTGPRPRFYSDSTWCFLLQDLPDGRTRLVVSGYASSRPRPLTAVADFLFWEPAHWVMQTRQLTNLKRRAEHHARVRAVPVGVGIDLYWLPLGAGGHCVRVNGRVFEAVLSRLEHRAACDLYHAALEVRVPEGRFVIEQAPVPAWRRGAARRRYRWRGRRALGSALSDLPLRGTSLAGRSHPRRHRGGGQPATGDRRSRLCPPGARPRALSPDSGVGAR